MSRYLVQCEDERAVNAVSAFVGMLHGEAKGTLELVPPVIIVEIDDIHADAILLNPGVISVEQEREVKTI